MSGFVTAFAGRRDGYQVPLALAEGGLLDRLVTTFYLTPWRERVVRRVIGRVPESARNRQAARLPADRVESLLVPELIEHLGRRLRLPGPRYRGVVNWLVGRAAGRAAAASRSDLLLYEPYAHPAFRRRYPLHTPRKVLFHFHPHPAAEAEVYRHDRRRCSPQPPWQTANDWGESGSPGGQHGGRAWKDADLILCASSFTRRSLLHAGADPAMCRVIPYGIDTPEEPPPARTDGSFRPLFVGTGIYRKGLHHLLTAWGRAKLPADSELTLVCRSMDPPLRAAALAAPRCRLMPGVSGAALDALYRDASILVVPSLVEGFGHVYLEALARGCPVLGTVNTGLPDLGGEVNGVFLTEVSDPDHLTFCLEGLSTRLPDRTGLRAAAWATAQRFSWAAFRSALVAALR
jgi:glycosyltransferase involved in cell wall biosynthesis